MGAPPTFDKLSHVALRTEVRYGATRISTATAFCYELDGATYLITNWHVVSGRDPITLKLLDTQTAALPDQLGVTLATVEKVDEKTSHIFWKVLPLALYEDAERTRPFWLEHPVHGHKVDVAVIPLGAIKDHFKITHANEVANDLCNLRLYTSLDVYVLGFPLGMTGGGQFPIWKRGTIASEPGIDLDGLPKFHIDTATRKGMSGAPVYAQDVGLITTENPTDSGNGSIGKARRFVGVYASRLDGDEFAAQLGVVWKEAAIREIVAGGKKGNSSFKMSE